MATLPNCGDYSSKNKNTELAIYSYSNATFNKPASYNKRDVSINLTYSKYDEMKAASAVDADLNGDGIKELVIGSGVLEAGIFISGPYALMQVLIWDGSKYKAVWAEPAMIADIGVFDYETSGSDPNQEPVAMSAAYLNRGSNKQHLFLEGLVFEYQGGGKGSDLVGNFSTGKFIRVGTMERGSGKDLFVSQAVSGVFSTAKAGNEQFIVLSGCHRISSGDTEDDIYYHIGWIWYENGAIKSKMTNYKFIDSKDEDDNGTFVNICALNIDDDTMKVKYRGKEYGWSAPVVHSVLQSPPYWKEVPYSSAGSVSYKMTLASKTGTDTGWTVGGGFGIAASAEFGVGLCANELTNTISVSGDKMSTYVNNHLKTIEYKESYDVTVPAGEDYVVLMAVPMISYVYDVWVPDIEITNENVNEINDILKDVPEASLMGTKEYKVGDIVKAHQETVRMDEQLTPAMSSIPLDKYNSLVEGLTGENAGLLEKIDDKYLSNKEIGDPTTYPTSENGIAQNSYVYGTRASQNSMAVGIGTASNTITLEKLEMDQVSSGYNLAFNFAFSDTTKEKISFVVTEVFSAGFTLKATGSYSKKTIDCSSKGTSFSVKLSDIPSGQSEGYKFYDRLVVYNLKNAGKLDNVYFLGHAVTMSSDSVPPRLPNNIRVFASGANEAILKWENNTYRKAGCYKIFKKDGNGNPFHVATVDGDKTMCLLTGLEPYTQYDFAIQSYSDSSFNNPSSMSKWINVLTKPAQDGTVKFITQPASVTLNNDSSMPKTITLNSKAETTLDGATISYQWQKFTGTNSGVGAWSNISGATNQDLVLNTSDLAIGEEYMYRVVVHEKKNSNEKTINSKIATVYIHDTDEQIDREDTHISINVKDGSITAGDISYIKDGESLEVEITVKDSNGNPVTSGELSILVEKDGQLVEHKIPIDENGKAKIVLNSSMLNSGNNKVRCIYRDPVGKQYYASESKEITVNLGDIEVEDDFYTVSYVLDGGINNPSNPDILTNKNGLVKFETPTKEGYKFVRWEYSIDKINNLDTERTVLKDSTLDTSSLKGNVTLYAVWKKVDKTHKHKFNKKCWFYDDNNHWHECRICKEKIDIGAHIYPNKWKFNKNYHWKICKSCKAVKKAKHNWVEIIDKEATEFKSGLKHQQCSECGYAKKKVKIPATHAHSYSDNWLTNKTHHWHQCRCGKKIAMDEHEFGKWIIDKKATRFTDGSKHKECNICGYKYTKEIPATGITAKSFKNIVRFLKGLFPW